jgi:predicted nucleotidyltransferase
VSTETNFLIQRAAAELKSAGAREIYVFGSAAKGLGDASSYLDLAVSGLPPSVLYRCGRPVHGHPSMPVFLLLQNFDHG